MEPKLTVRIYPIEINDLDTRDLAFWVMRNKELREGAYFIITTTEKFGHRQVINALASYIDGTLLFFPSMKGKNYNYEQLYEYLCKQMNKF